ncbi:hypothetical protein E4U53_005730 [Claviceps sorghi]|nr:hypothetical protein E4U53_005730 [Claviceps sorghi]
MAAIRLRSLFETINIRLPASKLQESKSMPSLIKANIEHGRHGGVNVGTPAARLGDKPPTPDPAPSCTSCTSCTFTCAVANTYERAAAAEHTA